MLLSSEPLKSFVNLPQSEYTNKSVWVVQVLYQLQVVTAFGIVCTLNNIAALQLHHNALTGV